MTEYSIEIRFFLPAPHANAFSLKFYGFLAGFYCTMGRTSRFLYRVILGRMDVVPIFWRRATTMEPGIKVCWVYIFQNEPSKVRVIASSGVTALYYLTKTVLSIFSLGYYKVKLQSATYPKPQFWRI